MKQSFLQFSLPVLLLGLASCASPKNEMSLEQKIARFSPTQVTADVSTLSAADRKALEKIVDAARLMDPIYLRQVWNGNEEMLRQLQGDSSKTGKEILHYFRINMGPWSLLDDNAPFVSGAPAHRPPGASYYPADMTKDEFDAWLQGLPEKDREKATGFFSVIRRRADKQLMAVPYSAEYGTWLRPASNLLKEAAELTPDATLKKFLTARADAFLTDDYYASDVAWMELDSPIELTIGPYETYMDELFGYKAAFEAFVTLRDKAESAKLARFSSYLQEIENNLPIDPKDRNPKLGALSPIRVVDVVYTSGEGNRGVQTAAFNLPNDERVVREKGSKRVMLKNVQNAKFDKVLIPISKKVLDGPDQADVSFDAFFTHILAHELVHGLGPHSIVVDGRTTNVRKELKDLYSAIEEAKADITGLFALQFLIDKGVVEKAMENRMYTTFLASAFRSVRFGISEAHGKGVALQFNYLVQKGGIVADTARGTFHIDHSKIKDAVRQLTSDILRLQAEGSYAKAKALLDTYGTIAPAMQKALQSMNDIPVDIEPVYSSVPPLPGAIR